MVHDTNANNTAPDPDSPGSDSISFSDWQTPTGAVIEVSIDTKIWPDKLINRFQKTALKIFDEILAAHGSAPVVVSLCLCDDFQMQQINRQHRQVDKATNVLSFPAYDMDRDKFDPAVPALFGDIIIASETVVREAGVMQISVEDHLIHLFVHGMLHLFGYDHVEDDMAEAMESFEIQTLAKVGIANPYENAQLELDR